MNDENDIPSKLRALRAKAGISVRDLARRLDVPASTYSNYEVRFKGRYLPVDFAHRLVAAYDGSAVARDDVMVLAGVGAEVAPKGYRQVQVYNVAASAGFGALVGPEEIVDQLSFPMDYLSRITRSSPKNLAIISVKGDSMRPTLSHDDVVMLDMSKTSLGFDGLFVLNMDGALHVKRITRASEPGWVTIISDNKDEYLPFRRRVEDVHVVGKVIWKGQKV
jgi:phage repressor protein C with HTH and peptisase S24 domain/DNA-binding XRE family transcriptional regulator